LSVAGLSLAVLGGCASYNPGGIAAMSAADMCELAIPFPKGSERYPKYPLPLEVKTDRAGYLKDLCIAGLKKRYGVDYAAPETFSDLPAEGSAKDHPVIDTVLKISGASVQEVHPVLAVPFDADVETKLTGLKDFSPKPWPERFREIQAAGGHVEIVRSRVQQGDLVSVAAGTLSLNAQGRIDGELQMTVAGIEKVIPALGIEKMLEEGVPQATLDRVAPGVKSQDLNNLFGALDRAIPGLGKAVKQNANAGVAAGINSLGKAAELEGKKARAFPLRFVDGAVFLGPLKVGQVPPLF